MTGAEAQAKQLDSVTDVVQEQEVDASKAQEAMSALSANDKQSNTPTEQVPAGLIFKEDIDMLVAELDITEDMATSTLQEVAVEQGITNRENHALVVAALRKLVTT